MTDDHKTRIDKFLWCVRIFKTRAQAMEACKKGRVIINDIPVKASRMIRKNEILHVKRPPVLYSYLVKDFPKTRIPYKLVTSFMDDITPTEELQKLEIQGSFFLKREKGSGRPTKKDRRTIERLNIR